MFFLLSGRMPQLSRSAAALTLFALLLALPGRAQAPASDPAPAAAAPVDDTEPSLNERRLVAYVATGVSVASLATGVTFGILAANDYACLSDVVACNKGLDKKIVGDKIFDARAELEQKSLIADMAYLVAAASAVVAVVGFLRGFVFVDGEEEAPSEAPATTATPASGPAAAPTGGAQ